MARKAKKLEEIRNLFEEFEIEVIQTEVVTILKELHVRMGEISDTRNESYVRHALGDIIMITLLAVLSNANEWQEVEQFGKAHEKWLKRFLKMEHGIPSDDTFRIVISSLNTNYVYGIVLRFLVEKIDELIGLTSEVREDGEKDIISFDGKSSNSSGRKETSVPGTKPLHTLNAYSSDYGFCITQNYVDEKTNEITSMPDILRRMDLKNAIATWDALNTQKEIVAAVKEGKGEYVGALKGNHKNLYQDVKDYFEPEVLEEIRKMKSNYKVTKEKEHSAIVTREYFITDDIKWLHEREKWAGLKAIGMELKTIQKNNPNQSVIIEARHFIVSFTNIDDFSRAVRSHWGVENWYLLNKSWRGSKKTSEPSGGISR